LEVVIELLNGRNVERNGRRCPERLGVERILCERRRWSASIAIEQKKRRRERQTYPAKKLLVHSVEVLSAGKLPSAINPRVRLLASRERGRELVRERLNDPIELAFRTIPNAANLKRIPSEGRADPEVRRRREVSELLVGVESGRGDGSRGGVVGVGENDGGRGGVVSLDMVGGDDAEVGGGTVETPEEFGVRRAGDVCENGSVGEDEVVTVSTDGAREEAMKEGGGKQGRREVG
jgi:hypothetical protein